MTQTTLFAPCTKVLDPSDPSNHGTMVVTILAMLISLMFAWRYWSAWLVATGISQPATVAHHSSRDQALSPGGSSSNNGSTYGPVRRSLQSLLPRRPSSLKTRLARLTQLKRIPVLPTLLLVTWIIYTFDQLMMLLLAIALIYTCPQYNCVEKILSMQPPDCTSTNYFSALIYLQTLGSCTFVMCILYRFINAFAVISRRRSQALRVTCALVVLITLYRLIGVVAIDIRDGTQLLPEGSTGYAVATTLNFSSYRAFYIMLGVSCVGGLSLGLQYVKQVRAQTKEAGLSSLVMPTSTIVQHGGGDAASSGSPSASDLLPSASSAVIPLNTRSAHLGGGASVIAQQKKRQQKHHHERIKQSWMVVFWIVMALGTVVGFAVIMLTSISDGLAPVFLNAFMTLFLKLFSGSVCLSIASMTRLVSVGTRDAGMSGDGMEPISS